MSFASGLTPSSAITVSDDVNIDEEVNFEALLDVSTGIYIEKEIAADTIGTIFAATKTHYLPYIEQSVVKLLSLLSHFYEGIRKSATDSLLEILRTLYDLTEPQEWQAGYGVCLHPAKPLSHADLYDRTLSRSTVVCRNSPATSSRNSWRCMRARTISTCYSFSTPMHRSLGSMRVVMKDFTQLTSMPDRRMRRKT